MLFQNRFICVNMLWILMPTFFWSCNNSKGKNDTTNASAAYQRDSQKRTPDTSSTYLKDEDSQTIELIRKIPVLCYHQVRDWTGRDSKSARTYILPVSNFKEQMQMLHDSGYNTVLPGDLNAYMEKRDQLPRKPIMLTFDDGTESQYNNALPELNKLGFKAVFFIMTVALNKKDYLTDGQVMDLVHKGDIIGCHTWDHHDVTKYTDTDWIIQIKNATAKLERIIGKPVPYFAYPYGTWDTKAINELKKYKFTLAFQLWGKTDDRDPLFTVRRILVDGRWNARQLSDFIRRDYAH